MINFSKFVRMDDSIIYYIILFVIYLIGMLFKNKKGKPVTQHPEKQSRPPQPASGSPKRRMPTSFEELLEEFGRESDDEPEEEIVYEESPQQRQKYRTAAYEKEIQQTYEQSVRDAENMKTLDEQITAEDMERKILKEPDEDEKAETRRSRYAELLRNPTGVRDAVILSEILNRKY